MPAGGTVDTMSDAESLMWRLEREPHLSSNIALVAILDRRPDHDVLTARLEHASSAIPRLRHLVHEVPANLAPPTFVPDPHFDIDAHVRRIALPAPGQRQQLLDLAALHAADPLDPHRPLWQVTIVEGLERSRAAVILKMHHTITDGQGAVELAAHLLDLERDALPPETPPSTGESNGADPAAPRDAAADIAENLLRLPRGVTQQVVELLADPSRIPEAGGSASESLRGLVSELGDVQPFRSPLWTTRSRGRQLLAVHASLGETKTVATRFGGTLNTAFVTVAAHAAGRYHDRFGAPVESMRASMAVSTRTDGSGANAFSLVRVEVPTAEMPIEERFSLVRTANEEAVGQSESGALEAVSALGNLLPAPLLRRLARLQTGTVDFVTSNVKGLPAKVYIAGAEVLHAYPVGPLMATAFNATLFSHRDRLDIGLSVDTGAVADPPLLATFFHEAFAELTASA